MSATNSYAFLANYKAMSDCLFSIQQLEQDGAFSTYPDVVLKLRQFETDVLRKLYIRTVRILAIIEGVITAQPEDLVVQGDFVVEDFSGMDFFVGYIDTQNNGFSSRFKTILNIFQFFIERFDELTEADKQNLDQVLIPVLDAFEELQDFLDSLGLNPCGSASGTLFLAGSRFNNSSSISLQAAGSVGTDGTSPGIHLRWSLLGELGENHIPKGDYANQNPRFFGYSRPNDYVRLYRTRYSPVRITLDLEHSKPSIDFRLKRWTFVVNSVVDGKTLINKIRFVFKSRKSYNDLALLINPYTDPFGFLSAYHDIIEIEFNRKTAFSVAFDFEKSEGGSSSELRFELHSASIEAVNPIVRKAVTTNSSVPVTETVIAENIGSVRLKKTAGSRLSKFHIETYSDFRDTRTEADWKQVENGFGLSLNDNLVFSRLENSNFKIDNSWPLYNDGQTVKASNYRNKWSTGNPDNPPIKEAVQQYLYLSENDSKAMGVFYEDGTDAEVNGFKISYIDIINLLSLDFHVARMLGLGHIDNPTTSSEGDRFIYKVRYVNREDLTSSEEVVHEYLSLPTSKLDSRLPVKPEIRSLEYKLAAENELSVKLFDSNGYSTLGDIRVISIGRKPYGGEITADFLIEENIDELNLSEHTKPVLYGVEYRRPNSSSYVKPEITSEEYATYDPDTDELPHPTPVPDNPESLYAHFVKEQGVHTYAIYGINIFSRVSELSDEVLSDNTVFPLSNDLFPPSDVSAQYIQKEDTLLFTTATEQAWLAGRSAAFPGEDVSLTRIVFNWLNIFDITEREPSSIVKPDIVKPYFRLEEPIELKGIIEDITPLSGTDNILILQLGGYAQLDGTLIEPNIHVSAFGRFSDSMLSTDNGQYRVLSIEAGPNDDVLATIEKIRDVDSVEEENPEANLPKRYGTYDVFKSPEVGSRFTIVENLSSATNWETISQTIQLVEFGTPVEEVVSDSEGSLTRYSVGGVNGSAIIEAASESSNNDSDLPGYYVITFASSITLPPHPQNSLPFDQDNPQANSPSTANNPYVEWYKGLVRIITKGGIDKKMLEVVRIHSYSPLIIYAYDASYDPEYPDLEIETSASSSDFVENVNFHPGYKAYLYPEIAAESYFKRENILPVPDNYSKRTLLGLQTTDTSGSGFSSRLSSPAILLALLQEEPIQMDTPVPLALKVRPDLTWKAAFTLDASLNSGSLAQNRFPFAVSFYRTSNIDILNALYQSETVTNILATLESLEQDEYYQDRYLELANLIFNSEESDTFRLFDALPAPYGFPSPDREGLLSPTDTTPSLRRERYREAIRGTLLPLTEQTPMVAFIKEGTQTRNKAPKIRTIDGALLDPSDVEFEPFPMIRKYQDGSGKTYIRFTDYTLNAASRSLYFYASAEVTTQLTTGPLSAFVGPVEILHTFASPAPLVRAFSVGSPSTVTESPVAVTFHLSAFSASDRISAIRLFRTSKLADTFSLLTMANQDVPFIEGSGNLELVDTFDDLAEVPLGQTLYYRLAGVREIINEENLPEKVISEATDIIQVNLVDVVNPTAPELTYVAAANKLTWNLDTRRGTYYLFKQNARGNWERLETFRPAVEENSIEYVLPILPKQDEEGDPIYHRFKVKVENSAGLFNLVENELTI